MEGRNGTGDGIEGVAEGDETESKKGMGEVERLEGGEHLSGGSERRETTRVPNPGSDLTMRLRRCAHRRGCHLCLEPNSERQWDKAP